MIGMMPLGAGLLQPQEGGGLLDPYSLSQGQKDSIRNKTMMSLGLGLLANSGPSLTPQSLGQNIGRAGMQALSQGDAARSQAIQENVLKRQMQKEGALGDAAGQFYADNPALAEVAKIDPQYAMQLAQRMQSGDPAAVRETEWFLQQSPEIQEQHMALKRSPQVVEFGGNRYIQTPNGLQQVSTLDEEASAVETTKEAGARGQARGKIEEEAAASTRVRLPQILEDAEQRITVLDQAINHPGLPSVVGVKDYSELAPGTPARNFAVLLDQIKGQTFMQAYQSLKGGGQITEIESQKAEQALARLDTAQSEEAFLEALMDLKEVISRGVQRAKRTARGDFSIDGSGEAAPRRKRYNPETGKVE